MHELWYLDPKPTFLCLHPSLTVPGGIAAESLTFTPLEDMIFLKWEEPQEPNGCITQYEVNRGPGGGQSSFLCCDGEGGVGGQRWALKLLP